MKQGSLCSLCAYIITQHVLLPILWILGREPEKTKEKALQDSREGSRLGVGKFQGDRYSTSEQQCSLSRREKERQGYSRRDGTAAEQISDNRERCGKLVARKEKEKKF